MAARTLLRLHRIPIPAHGEGSRDSARVCSLAPGMGVMGRWAGWAMGLALLAGCGTRTGVGTVSGVEQQGPDGGGSPSCMGPAGSLLASAGSGAPSCADLFRPLGPGEVQPW